jgi:hypothetical protein
VPVGVFGTIEEFEVLRPVVPPDTVSMMDMLVCDGVEPAFCHHYESVNPNGIRRPAVVRRADDVATVGEHGGMPSSVRGCLARVSAWNVEPLHPF